MANQRSSCTSTTTPVTPDVAFCNILTSMPPADYSNCMLSGFLNIQTQMTSLKSPQYIKDAVYRSIIHQYSLTQPNCNTFAVFPAYKIDPALIIYDYTSAFYIPQRAKMAANGSTLRMLIQGPIEATDTGVSKFIMPLSITWKESRQLSPTTSDDIYFHIRVEILLEVFGEFALSHNFRSQNEVVAMRKSGTFVYAPPHWHLTSSSQHVFDPALLPYSGVDYTLFTQLLTNQNQVTVTRLDTSGVYTEYLVSILRLNDQFDPNNKLDCFSTGVDSDSQDNYYIVYLYGKKSQMYEVLEDIDSLATKQQSVTIWICCVTGFITLTLVYVATYLVSVQVDRPLKAMILIIKKLNTRAQIQQKTLKEIKNKLEQLILNSQHQVKDLLISFKQLIEKLIKRNESGKTNTKKLKIEYPLNEFEKTFVNQTKGSQFKFDWEKVIPQIPNLAKIPDSKEQQKPNP